ncbi:BLUF domain-containing protein [Hymenobacter properus]|uniref:BLUF domain-containing protein n=1 Tax=Hymenobacter properus TaxID=2791026 RepID=A0A931BH96_9BACT|nr:BLUF domain-containing protein [Hymenobacter properus]MBF9143915.1 BLUF domain-containing protein [Hymenobacter properus]MBR7722729.1 BLUF domain-containing protein [Microvirga sp. SRT04]
MESLHHLVYQSSATTGLNEAELTALLTQSRNWNHGHELTGLLLYSNGDIMQVLEGPKEEVYYIFNRIAQDARHGRVVKLSDGPIAARRFSQWSMGFKALKPEEFTNLQGYVNPQSPGYLSEQSLQPDRGLHAVLAGFVVDDVIRL